MRTLVTAVGTRGDVQPALALAIALREHGHGVRLCLSPNFVEWATRLGLEAVPMGVEMRAPARASGSTLPLTPEQLRRLRESMPDLITDQFDTLASAAEGYDVIVGCNAHQYAAPSIAEHKGIACVTAVYAPVALPSPDLAPPLSPGQTVEAAAALSIEERWRQTARAWNERALERINRNRDRLGMAPVDDVLAYVLAPHTWLAADPTLAPAPTTPGRSVCQTGAWMLDERTPLPADLEAFLDRGAPPVFVGFGSMPAGPEVSRTVIAAVRALGRRLIVSRGWAELEAVDDADDCLAVGDVSHNLLLPRVAAVVHHGGAGTTVTAARAGVPQVVTPMFSDQFYFASRVVALGLGATTSYASMTAESLTEALLAALRQESALRARAVADHVRLDGTAVAVHELERVLGSKAR